MKTNNNLKKISLFICVSVAIFFYILRPFQLIEPKPEKKAAEKRFLPDDLLKNLPYSVDILNARDISYRDAAMALEKVSQLDAKGVFNHGAIYRTYYFLILRNIALLEGDRDKINYYNVELSLLAKNHEFPWLKAELIIDAGIELLKKGKMDEGIVLIEKAIMLSKSVNYNYLLVKAYNTLGVAYNIQSQYVKALEYYHLGIKLGRDYPSHSYNSKLIANLGLIYIYLEEWDKALDYIDRSSYLYTQSKIIDGVSIVINNVNLSYIYFNLGDAEKTRIYYDKGANQLDSTEDVRIVGLMRKTEADTLWIEDRYKESLAVANRCLQLPEIETVPQQHGLCLIAKSRTEIYFGNIEIAIKSLELALERLESINNASYVIKTYQLLAEAYEQSGNTELAYKYFKLYAKLDKDILFDRRQSEVYHLEEQFNTKQIKKNMELTNTQSELKTLYVEKQKLRTRVVASILILVGFGLFFLIRRNFTIEKEKEVLVEQSTTDALTGLNNRHYYNHALKELELNKALHEKKVFTAAVLDIDHFKAVNDTYGHDIGDAVLQNVAARLTAVIDDSDILVRWGGEEFVCLLPESKFYGCEVKLERLRMAISQLPISIDHIQKDLIVTISIGAIKNLTIDDVLYINKESLQLADVCLYRAKQEGRNRVVFESKEQLNRDKIQLCST
ncbi:membrane associated GGDEF protein [Aliivibrio wodanis]|uniref:diguanylate cyclase n=1 Tax=Aliivibrio wodanis TaxID=80852 RepID=A0A090IQ56_9GAMM|nr:membrane associated GGDEF protein [Aliivibrio wodanis]